MINNISRIAVGSISAIMILGAAAGGTSYAKSVVTKNSLIDEETAEEFALLDAGLEEEDVQGMKIRLERDKGIYVYDVSFYAGTSEYEYEIQAEDGAVIEKDIEIKKAGAKNEMTENRPAEDAVENNEQSSANDSVNFERTKNSTSVSAHKNDSPSHSSNADQNLDDETAISDGTSGQSHPVGYISVDEAKQIALQSAGLSAAEVRFSKAKLENDHESVEYEIEFYCGQLEYEYDIDAVTGEILEWSAEKDDD